MAWKVAPLNSTFLAVSIIGLLVSIFYLTKFSLDWAFAFGALFLAMLISSFISMTKGPPEPHINKKKIR